MSAETYVFRCDRCDSAAFSAYRAHVQEFAGHHYNLVHPLYAGDNALRLFAEAVVPDEPEAPTEDER